MDYQLLERKGENEMFTVFEETWKDGEQAGRTGISCNLHKRDRVALLNYKCYAIY